MDPVVSPNVMVNTTTTIREAPVVEGVKFTCCLCQEETVEVEPHRIGEFPICLDCSKESIVGLIERATKYEHDYPPAWGEVQVNASEFEDVIPTELLLAYRERQKEYDTPAASRIYCAHKIVKRLQPTEPYDVVLARFIVGVKDDQTEPCGHYIGPKVPRTIKRRVTSHCVRCLGSICRRCGASVEDSREHTRVCNIEAENAKREAEAAEAFQDLVRGKDFQICPNKECGRRVLLGDGCNELTCPQSFCKKRFCNLCGQEVELGHFDPGKPCPRFGRPGDPNRIYDTVVLSHQQTYDALQQYSLEIARMDEEASHPSFPADWVGHLLYLERVTSRLLLLLVNLFLAIEQRARTAAAIPERVEVLFQYLCAVYAMLRGITYVISNQSPTFLDELLHMNQLSPALALHAPDREGARTIDRYLDERDAVNRRDGRLDDFQRGDELYRLLHDFDSWQRWFESLRGYFRTGMVMPPHLP